MRTLLWVLLAGVLLWAGWWTVASVGMQRAIAAWIVARKAEGWQAEVADIERGGFPTHLRTRLVAPQIADPETGVAVELAHIDISAPAWWPGYVDLRLPETPVLLASPLGRSYLTLAGAGAEMRVKPGARLELRSMLAGAEAWRWFGDDATLLTGDALRLQAAQAEGAPETYRIDFDALNLTPGDDWRAAIRLPADWPQSFESLSADMTVIFDRPWDREALSSRRPQPVVITLHGVKAVWGKLAFRAVGDLSIDPFGVPEGLITLKAENWQAMLDLAQTSGLVTPLYRLQLETVLGALAQATGSTKGLDVEIRFRAGRMSVGPIQLGPAPKLRIR